MIRSMLNQTIFVYFRIKHVNRNSSIFIDFLLLFSKDLVLHYNTTCNMYN